MSDEDFLKKAYRLSVKSELNLDCPERYTEKLQWIKAFDHNPMYSMMVDKYEVKKFVSETIGEKYVIPTIGIWDCFKDIDFSKLPKQFVLKCTHDSGGYAICRDKSRFNAEDAEKKLSKRLKRSYYMQNREWPYKNVKPRIIAEEYLEDDGDGELRDYKFFTFGGVPKIMYIAQGRGNEEAYADFFDMDFNHLNMRIDHKNAPEPPHKPKNFELMKELAAKLSAGTPQLRVDFYEANGRVYFGELTFFHCSGLAAFDPPEWDEILGSWVDLPQKQ